MGHLVLAGCAGGSGSTQAQSGAGQSQVGSELFGSNSGGARGGRGGSASQSDSGWSIVIAHFPADEDGAQRANYALQRVRTAGRLPEARMEDRGDRIVIIYGSYTDLNDRRAREDLQRIRGLTIDDERPYSRAIIGPPAVREVYGEIPEFDLRNARQHHGQDKDFTLQIAIYGRQDGDRPSDRELTEIRRTAETAVAELRREGQEAFYFHGSTRSTVTVGLFTEDEVGGRGADGVRRSESMRLREVRREHPNNLLNGQGIRERIPGTRGNAERNFRLQPSQLVMVPQSS
ncbi:MAG: hypothetical protein JJU33_11710 [Phycisphaerales bacterium]|nr:hypothetical protein [Phycisphaerales bacterium]